MKASFLVLAVLTTAAHAGETLAQVLLNFRQEELLRTSPQIPPPGSVPQRTTLYSSLFTGSGPRYPWHTVTSTEFWIGERASHGDPGNCSSAWVHNWKGQYGGIDIPTNRRGFLPAGFVPRQNPFYIALPVNDICGNHTVPQAAQYVPWFKESWVRDGRSVCHGHWVAIRKGNLTAYGVWADVGPFRTDSWSYVFGNEAPSWNKNQSAGIDLSPAIIDYLSLRPLDTVDWRFVNCREVPPGPWAIIRDNSNSEYALKN